MSERELGKSGWHLSIFCGAGAFALLWWIAVLTQRTTLLSGVSPLWSLGAGGGGGAVLGGTLGFCFYARSADRACRFLAFLVVSLAGLFGLFGASLGERIADAYLFSGQAIDTTRREFPIETFGRGRGSLYLNIRGGGGERFAISHGDYALLDGAEKRGDAHRHCLPLIFERAGQAVRVRLPQKPRPSRTRRTITLVRCSHGGPPAKKLS